jgi:glycosyltransferase involved in cell wall biosynthesis
LSDSLNIAVVGACPYPVPQGSQVYLRNTALALRAAGHNVHLVAYGYGHGDDTSGLPLHRAANVPLARRTAAGPSIAKPMQDALLVRKLREVVRTQRIDVVNAHNYEGLAVALAARARPIVYHPHNALMDELPHYFPARGLAEIVGRALDKALPRRADLVIAPHEELAGYLMAVGCAADRMKVVPPPIDMDVVAPNLTYCETPSLFYAGNLDRYQNLEALRHVMTRVRAEFPHAELMVATAATRAKDLLAVSEFARVVRTDSMAVALRDLSRGAVFVCPRVSWSGYPIKLLNAMAAGLPIVCFEAAAYPLTEDETGLIVRDNDGEAFAAAAVRLLRDAELRARLGTSARHKAEQEYSIQAAAARLDPLFRDLGKRVR